MAPNKARSLSLFVLGVSLSSAACSESEPVVRDSISTWEVRRGDLKISVTEKAEIQAAPPERKLYDGIASPCTQ